MSHELLRLPAVMQRTGMGRSSIYAAVKRGEFPAQVKIGPRASGWIANEVDTWIKQRIAASRTAA